MKTDAEILARLLDPERREHDLFGFGSEVLAECVTLELARTRPEAFRPEALADPALWEDAKVTEDQRREAAVGYLRFAFGKAIDHRGLSAGRSVGGRAAPVIETLSIVSCSDGPLRSKITYLSEGRAVSGVVDLGRRPVTEWRPLLDEAHELLLERIHALVP